MKNLILLILFLVFCQHHLNSQNLKIVVKHPDYNSLKYNLKRIRGVASSNESILSVIYGVPKNGFSNSYGNHFINTTKSDGNSLNLYSSSTNNQISYNNDYIGIYNSNKEINDYNSIYFCSSNSNSVEFNEMIITDESKFPKIKTYSLPLKFELNSNGIETFQINSYAMGNGIGAFLGKSTYDHKSYLFIYDYKNNREVKKIDISNVSPSLVSSSIYGSGACFKFTKNINGTNVNRSFVSIQNVIVNEKFIYVFLTGGDMEIVLPICVSKFDNSISIKSNSLFNCKSSKVESDNLCGYLNKNMFYLPELKGFANCYIKEFNYQTKDYNYQIDIYNSNIEKQYSLNVKDITIESINDKGDYIIVGGYTQCEGYKGYPNPKLLVINKSTKTVCYSKVLTKKNASVNSICHDKNNKLIIAIGSTTCKGDAENDDYFSPQIILDELNESGKFVNDIEFKVNNEINSSIEICDKPDENAEFPGGVSAFISYFQTNIEIPEKVINERIIGKCYIKFIVMNDGSIKNVNVYKGIPNCIECDEEGVRVIKNMPKWNPAKLDGKAVNQQNIIPINFKYE